MKKLVVWLFLAMCLVQNGWSISIERVEPLCWWTGMKNPELQIMVCGKDIGGAQVEFDYAGVTLKETVRLENPDYLLLYLNISPEAKPGQMKLVFKQDNQVSERNFELKARNTKPGAAGFSPADVMYLITPDRFANADSSNDNLDEVIRRINIMPHPLALYFFTSDKSAAKKVTSRCGFGGGCINDTIIHLATTEMGFGGFGESGMGAYHGKIGFDTFSHYKSIVDKKTWIDLPMRYQPYRKIHEKMVRFFLK